MEEERSQEQEEKLETAGLDIPLSPEELLSRFETETVTPEEELAEEEPVVEAPVEEEVVPQPEPEAVAPVVSADSPSAKSQPAAEEAFPEDISPQEMQEQMLRNMPAGDLLPDPFADEKMLNGEQKDWFVVHCYSGSEQKVQHNLQQRVESMGMRDNVYQVVVPTVEEIEIKDGERETVERCLYPGYIMIQMIYTEDAWYMVRNTPGVTGFVGTGHKPVPLRREQVKSILHRMEEEAPRLRTTFQVDEKVRIIEGPFADFIGVVQDIDETQAKLHVLVSFFGRETPVELDFLQIEKT